MMITAVERAPRRRGRFDVYVDGERAFDADRSLLGTHALRPGRPIEPDEIAAIVSADERTRALAAAVALLARRPRSERDIRQRLVRRGLGAAGIDHAIDRLRSLGYVDDAAFARGWAESRDLASPRGRRLIVQELRQRGVGAEAAQAAADPISDSDAAYRAAVSRARSLATRPYDVFRARLGSYLQRRGFSWSVARATVDRCWREAAGSTEVPEIIIE